LVRASKLRQYRRWRESDGGSATDITTTRPRPRDVDLNGDAG
jgi:hypothetical protein